jgi:hypothetical protein
MRFRQLVAVALVTSAPIAIGVGWGATPAWALGAGAPPIINFAAVWVDTFQTDAFTPCATCGVPQLFANLGVTVPGGSVPLNILSVTVQTPLATTHTVPLDEVDLSAEESFFVNLTAAGVPGFPTGTYTFTVTDTSGGVSQVSKNLTSGTALPTPAAPAIIGSTAVPSADGSAGVVTRLVNLFTNPTPTISFTQVAGAGRHRVRIREGFADVAAFGVDSTDPAFTSVTIPAGVLVQGRRYVIRIEAFDAAAGFGCTVSPNCVVGDLNARSTFRAEIITQGPEFFLNTSGGTGAGQTLTVNLRVYNTGPTVTGNVLMWIGLPGGLGVINVLSLTGVSIPQNQNANIFNGGLFSHTFTGGEPSGHYVVGIRLTDPATGATMAFAQTRFTK